MLDEDSEFSRDIENIKKYIDKLIDTKLDDII
jgi:hypothetical protein